MDEVVYKRAYSLEELPEVAEELLASSKERVFLFYAEMGAGKTTLIKELCRKLGSSDHFSSPTYSLVNEYACGNGKIFHFDLYRVKNAEELMDLGFEEYLDSGSYCFIEWPQLAEEFVEGARLNVKIDVDGDKRVLTAWRIKF
jgi:tRNA threonylcarbamoyladenosine biosynthesis protein TsaE